MSSAELIVRMNDGARRFSLEPGLPYGIGRSRQNAICLLSDKVSRHHALIKEDETGAFCLFDLGSRNGTLLNQRIVRTPAQLRDGDVIAIGDATLTFSQSLASDEPQLVEPFLASEGTILASDLADVTVLVADIRGFTTLSQSIETESLAEVIGSLNSQTSEFLDRSGAWSTKFIGDAVMAVWLNKAEPVTNMALTALSVCLDIHIIAEGLNTRFELSNPVRLGAGINVGPAYVGNIGGGSTVDYTALGDTVNRAFRLEASTRKLECDLAFGAEVYDVLSLRSEISHYVKKHRCLLKGYVHEADVYGMGFSDIRNYLSVYKAALETSGA